MSKMIVCSVYDSKVKAFARPFFQKTVGEALRSFGEVVNDSSTQLYKYSEDFCLMHLGEWDEETGFFESLTQPLNLGMAASVKRHVPLTRVPDQSDITDFIAKEGA